MKYIPLFDWTGYGYTSTGRRTYNPYPAVTGRVRIWPYTRRGRIPTGYGPGINVVTPAQPQCAVAQLDRATRFVSRNNKSDLQVHSRSLVLVPFDIGSLRLHGGAEDLCVCVCVWVGRQGSLALAGSLSRRRKTLTPNRGRRSPLASSGTSATLSMRRPYSPIVSDLPCHWVLSMFHWRRGTTGRDVFSR